ncbi:uncharacterized protein LOC143599333 [Bidens hawaiensis]|uniref:uncharacterized protein LOC143554200 n=1 Tax=Bidens hawaiensis TaxID=980011 RepID=UPI0040493876
MADFQAGGGVKKLNNQNYKTWSTCIQSYLQGQDLWEVVNGGDTTLPRIDTNGAINNWRIKVGKSLFVLKTTVEEEILEHIREAETPKAAWDILVALFSKRNDAKLQLLENELLSIAQRDITIPQYFHKVKSLCREIGELDPQGAIGESRMKRIIVHGLKSEYHSFVAALQGWQTQPTLNEFGNLLASQEALVKQMSGATVKTEEEAMYAEKRKGKGHYKPKGGYSKKYENPR